MSLQYLSTIRNATAAALASLLCVSTGGPAWAAETAPALSLPALLKEARRANPDLLAARKRWEAAQAKVPLSKGLPAPRIGIEFEEIPRRSVKFNQADLMYSLIQALPFPGKLSARHQVAVKEAQMAAAAFKQAEWDVASQVKDAYYELFMLDREQELQEELIGWLSQATTAAAARYAAGTASQAELLRSQAEQLEASNQLRVLEHRREAMAAHLNHLLSRPVHQPIGHPGPLPLEPVPLTMDEAMTTALELQPELLMFKYSAERSDAALKLAKRELLPDLETMFELRDPAMGPIGPWDLSLAVAIPFWFWTKLKYGVKVAVYDQQSAHAAYDAMRNEISKRVHEQWHEAAAAYDTAKLDRDGLLALRRQSVGSALSAYRGGRGDFMEVLDALRALQEQERTYYQALVALEQHIIMLEQAVGVPLRAAHQAAAGEEAQ